MINKPKIERDQNTQFCTITLPETIYEGYKWIKFKNPLKIQFDLVPLERNGCDIVFFNYDFGMDGEVTLDRKHNFVLNTKGCDTMTNEEKVVLIIIFDLFHAFFHPSQDPNYSYYHWALFGNLKDRVEYGEREENCE